MLPASGLFEKIYIVLFKRSPFFGVNNPEADHAIIIVFQVA